LLDRRRRGRRLRGHGSKDGQCKYRILLVWETRVQSRLVT
jgi:hypothetical protein